MRLAIVEWLDSYASHGWEQESELNYMHPSKCVSVGILRKKDDCIQITQSQTSEKHIDHTIVIPKCAVKRIRYLRIR